MGMWSNSQNLWTVNDPKSYNKSAKIISDLQSREEEQLAGFADTLYKKLDEISKKTDTLKSSLRLLENNVALLNNLIDVLEQI